MTSAERCHLPRDDICRVANATADANLHREGHARAESVGTRYSIVFVIRTIFLFINSNHNPATYATFAANSLEQLARNLAEMSLEPQGGK